MSSTFATPDDARTELYEIMRADDTFEEKADRALELGEKYLGVQNAHLTRIDPRIEFWQAVASTDPPDGEFPVGAVHDLQSTYCRRVVEQGSTIALSDAPAQGWADDPAFVEHGLHCYHGTPLTIDDEVWGTLCFVSEEPRDEPFSADETLFAELIARLLEHELRSARLRSEIGLQSNLIGVLSRVLRHNLRNDLNVIRGQLTMLAEESEEAVLQDANTVDKIDKLVELANTARQIESIASSDLDRQPVELNALLENVIERVEQTHPSASIALEGPDEIYIEAIPSLRTGLQELVENAAKHAGDEPQVRVAIDQTPDEVYIDVIDDGPGLPQQEREVLRKGSESPLIHGSGLGLWLSYWIIANHDGSIQTDVTDEGTRISVTLPKSSALSKFADSESLLGRFYREQDKFEAVFDESFDGIALLDDDGHFTEVNQSAAELVGLSPEELRGRSYAEFVPDYFDVEAGWAELMESGGERRTFTLNRPDGTERIVESTAVANIIPGEHLAILRDVSERVEQEREMLQTKNRLEAIIEASPDPILVVDDQGTVELWNDAAEEVYGYTVDEVVGEPLQSVVLHDESDVDGFAEQFERAMNGERIEDLVVSRQTKDGDEIQVSLSTAPIQDASGDISGVVGVAKDVTERIERERRFEALSKGFPDICFIMDEEGQYQEVLSSPTSDDLLIGDPDELVGQSVTEVLPPEQGQLVKERIELTAETGEPQLFRYELRVPAGRRLFEARSHPLKDDLTETRLVSMVVRDITDLPGGEEVAKAT